MSGKDDCQYIDFDGLHPQQRAQFITKHIYVSYNSKTGLSVNSRIKGATVKVGGLMWRVEGSCHPTEWCSKHCYARAGHFATWNRNNLNDLSHQQKVYLLNSMIFNHYANSSQGAVDREADSIVGRVYKKGFDNVRWNGGGDLSPGAVRIINSITSRYPNFRVWGFSRRADMISALNPAPNLHMIVSTDPTTPPCGGRRGDNLMDLIRASIPHGGRMAYATEVPRDGYIRELESLIDDVSEGLARLDVVFGEHRGPRHTTVGYGRECPATMQINDAGCQSCQWCFMNDQERGVLTPLGVFLLHQHQAG